MFLDTGGDAHQAASGAPASLGVPPMRNDALIGISCNRLTGLYRRTDTEIVGHDEPAMDLRRSLAAVGVERTAPYHARVFAKPVLRPMCLPPTRATLEQLSSSFRRQGVTRVGEPRDHIVAGNAFESPVDRVLERFVDAGAQSAQPCLELGERLLDRREVRGVGRQEEQLALTRGQGLADAGGFVGAQIVEHDDLPRPQPRCSRLVQRVVAQQSNALESC